MKCVNTNCTNIILDFTGNTDGECAKCRMLRMIFHFENEKPDTERLEQTQVDKQTLAERSNTL